MHANVSHDESHARVANGELNARFIKVKPRRGNQGELSEARMINEHSLEHQSSYPTMWKGWRAGKPHERRYHMRRVQSHALA